MESALNDVKKIQKPAKKKVVKRSILKDIGNIKTASVLDDVLEKKGDKSQKPKVAKVKKVAPKGHENEDAKAPVAKKTKVPKKKEVPQIKGQMKMTAFFRI